jgi:hypothetical protein
MMNGFPMNRMVSQGAIKKRVSKKLSKKDQKSTFYRIFPSGFFVSQLVLRFFSPLKKALEDDFWVIFVDELSRTDGSKMDGSSWS